MFVAVGAGGVPPQLTGAGFFEELFSIGKGFQIEEFWFDAFVERFDVGLVVLSSDGDETVFCTNCVFDDEAKAAVGSLFLFHAGVFASVVGLNGGKVAQRVSGAAQVGGHGHYEAAGVHLG